MTGTVKRSPKTDRGAQTRDELLDSARDVFWEKGYLQTRVADIVERAGVSHGTFYTYFDSKEDVLWALAGSMHDILAETGRGVRAEVGGNEVAAIELATRRYLEAYLANRRLACLVENVAAVNKDMRELRSRTRTSFVRRVQRSISRLQDDNLADADLDAGYAAEALVSMIGHFAYHHVVNHLPFDVEVAVPTLTTIWARGIGLTMPGK